MIYTESAFKVRVVGVLVVALLLLSACTSDSPAATTPQPTTTETTEAETPVVETPTATPTQEPAPAPTETPTPEPEPLGDAEMIDIARAAFDADPQPGELIAWDHLDATAFDDRVRLDICSWTGETVFDDLRIVEYEIDAEGTATYIFDGSVPGDCLNTELVESALAFTSEFDTYWGGVLDDPTTFDPAIDLRFASPIQSEAHTALAAMWVNDGAHWEGLALDSGLPESSVRPIAWRRYSRDDLDFDVLGLTACRELAPDFGLYRGDILVDDERGPNSVGPHAVHNYQLIRVDQRWVTTGLPGLSWADCFAVDDWAAGVTLWQPEPVPWNLLP